MKAVIFDLDNTLYSYDRAHAAAYAALQSYALQELGLDAASFDRLHEQASRTLEQRCHNGPAIHNRLIRFQILLELLGRPIGKAPEMADCYWRTLLGSMQAEPGAAETLQELRTMGLSVGIGTNMTADRQLEKLRLLGLLPHVDFMVTSEELGVEKPDPRLFALCAEKAGAEPAECCFVGDSLKKDALAAQNAGLLGVWYCPGTDCAAPEGVVKIRALSELTALLR